MSQISNLDEPFVGIYGQPLPDRLAVPQKSGDDYVYPTLTKRAVLLHFIGMCSPKDVAGGGEAIVRLTSLGERILHAKDGTVSVDKNDLELLKRVIEANGPQYVMHVYGPILKEIEKLIAEEVLKG